MLHRNTSPLARPFWLHAALPAALLGAAATLFGACSSDGARSCSVNADCASGLCLADGTCAPAGGPGTDSGGPGPVDADGGATTDAPAASDAPTTTVDGGGCVANNDGIITAAEVPLRAGLKGTFKVTTSGVKVSTAGTGADGGGKRTWDFSAALTGDHTLVLETLALTGQWFESTYPGAAYYSRLSDKSDLLGIFAPTANALELRGIVSPASGSSQTKVKYDPAVATLAFPLEKGKKWESSVSATGDIPANFNFPYSEKYSFEVDAEGDLTTSTSLGAFKVLRVAVVLKRTPSQTPLLSYYTRQYVYVAECYGAIAKVVSAIDELSTPPAEFTDASEVQRLSP